MLNFTAGETSALCTNNADAGDAWLIGAFATYINPDAYVIDDFTVEDQLEFAFSINPTTNLDGTVKVKIFHTDSSGSWIEAVNLSELINVSETSPTAYVANTAVECGTNSPCYVNSGDDAEFGLGTGLRDFVTALDPGSRIFILGNYEIKTNTVVIDKDLTILGYENGMITYNNADCNQPMLSFTGGGIRRFIY